ncbi:MAG: lipopolysaccharide heptosyltransferase family protein [Synechococcaceae cyanobacterium]|nr:lipopolysaccharide heptosyltransferase family protein [Synechococcaceae cyanobacterium]
MRALFLIPGDAVSQLQAMPAVAAVAQQLRFSIQVACAPAVARAWSLLPAVEKVIPFNFSDASLADWANLLGCVREPDFQACINLARGRQVDLMLSMSHIPARIAAAGFSATERVSPAQDGWPSQALEAYLRPIGVRLDAGAFRLSLAKPALEQAQATLPAGDGPMLLLSPAGVPGDWPADQWQQLPQRIGGSLSGLRTLQVPAADAAHVLERAALVACSDVVLASDPLTEELALLCGVPLVALGRSHDTLPQRSGVAGLTTPAGLSALSSDEVLSALGLS